MNLHKKKRGSGANDNAGGRDIFLFPVHCQIYPAIGDSRRGGVVGAAEFRVHVCLAVHGAVRLLRIRNVYTGWRRVRLFLVFFISD